MLRRIRHGRITFNDDSVYPKRVRDASPIRMDGGSDRCLRGAPRRMSRSGWRRQRLAKRRMGGPNGSSMASRVKPENRAASVGHEIQQRLTGLGMRAPSCQ